MRPATKAAILLLAATTSACRDPLAGSGSEAGADMSSNRESGVVTWIDDGDTVRVDQDGAETRVRLLGVNAPDQGECFHEEATDYMIDVLKGEPVDLEVNGVDQFGRTLAYVWIGDELVNLTLVAEGWAIATTPDETDTHGSILLEAEQTAFDQRIGLWDPAVCGSGMTPPGIELDVEFNPPGPDGEALAGEVVNLRNEGEGTVDLAGWVLRDESSAHRFHFADITLESGTSLEVTSADPGWDPGSTPVWNNDGDMAMLLDANGAVVARLRWAEG